MTPVSWPEAFRTWCRVALLSFGGPTGQIAVMHRILVEEKHWISEERFLHALNYCMLLPGPEATQLATYIGWLMHRTRGGIMAGVLFILPGFVALMLLSILYVFYGTIEGGIIAALFFGLKAAVIAIVVEAVIRIGRRVLKNEVMLAIAVLAFIAVFFLEIPFPLVVLTAGLVGLVGEYLFPAKFHVLKGHAAKPHEEHRLPVIPDGVEQPHMRPSWQRLLSVLLIGGLLWFGPIVALRMLLPRPTPAPGAGATENVLVEEGVYFSKAAMVTFGGAYAVLTYVAQDAVEQYAWLSADEMLVGLGMAETTPGPLIMVLQFVGFMGAYRLGPEQTGWPPLVCGVLGACVTVWVTFVPCFVWIFAGAPYVERARANQRLSAALSAITAAVVGCVLNLSVWFTLQVLFQKTSQQHIPMIPNILELRLLWPVWQTLHVDALLTTLFAAALIFWFKRGLAATLAGSVALGATLYLLRQ